jgi:hypothetical protein
MDLHRTSAPCNSCGEHSLFLWLGRDGTLICQSCVAAIVRKSDREIARIRRRVGGRNGCLFRPHGPGSALVLAGGVRP